MNQASRQKPKPEKGKAGHPNSTRNHLFANRGQAKHDLNRKSRELTGDQGESDRRNVVKYKRLHRPMAATQKKNINLLCRSTQQRRGNRLERGRNHGFKQHTRGGSLNSQEPNEKKEDRRDQKPNREP